MTSSRKDLGASSFELAISYLLAVGVVASLFFLGLGMILFYLDFGHWAISEKKALFLREKDFFHFLWDLLKGQSLQEKATWVMTLGIALLILTPYLRVLLSVFYFIAKRDRKYAVITLFVFLLLTASLLFH
jgi:uncharacterized membrane protein